MSAIDPMNKYQTDSFEDADNLQSPRTFKTHLMYYMLPRQLRTKAKVNFLAPISILVSSLTRVDWRVLNEKKHNQKEMTKEFRI